MSSSPAGAMAKVSHAATRTARGASVPVMRAGYAEVRGAGVRFIAFSR
jgi:hypothetical protein